MAACISVRITCLKRTYYLLDLRKRVCQNSHTSAYAGATRCSVTGPLDRTVFQKLRGEMVKNGSNGGISLNA